MLFKTGFYTLFFVGLSSFILKLDVSPLPVILPVFIFHESFDAIFINIIITKQVNKKVNRFLSNTINMHKIHPLYNILIIQLFDEKTSVIKT